MKRVFKNTFKIAFIIAVVFLVFLSVISGVGGNAYAAFAESSYSNVLDDLRKDSEFRVDDFPAYDDDYRIYVINIAEGEKGNLYVYTYQPCQLSRPLSATHLNMSLTDSVNDTEIYGLTKLNETGVFVKYRVQGVTVASNKSLRYYNISSIYREYINGIDDIPSSNDNIINEKAFPVAKLYYVMTQQDGSVVYSLDATYVVQIINPVSSYLTIENSDSGYNSGLGPFANNYRKWQYTDLHYVAFSTDWDIDRLISATVYYSYCSGQLYDYDWTPWVDVKDGVEYGDAYETTVDLNYTESFDITHKDTWSIFTLSKHTYSWDKIYSVDDFYSTVCANSDYDKNGLKTVYETVSGREWVLMFAETERKEEKEDGAFGFIYYDTYFTKVDKVSVLRLEFETDGVVYNLGAVSDTVSNITYPSPNAPDNGDRLGFWEYIWYCIKALLNGTASNWEIFVAVATFVICGVLAALLASAVSAIVSVFK